VTQFTRDGVGMFPNCPRTYKHQGTSEVISS